MKINRDEILNIWYNLPSVSEIDSERIQVPIYHEPDFYNKYIDLSTPKIGTVTFRKQRINGIAIGWELCEQHEDKQY